MWVTLLTHLFYSIRKAGNYLLISICFDHTPRCWASVWLLQLDVSCRPIFHKLVQLAFHPIDAAQGRIYSTSHWDPGLLLRVCCWYHCKALVTHYFQVIGMATVVYISIRRWASLDRCSGFISVSLWLGLFTTSHSVFVSPRDLTSRRNNDWHCFK